ncbi:AraC-type DNA-binding protein [Mucilaginibacter pineti]|uniref:AraC-type DNA-binding protein n=1 Tax=Mucilaginibacter pineti TaxID=1391627 RepID=A0A1G6Z9T2_9SPHI|nr:helix-turn-helix transcriptional regulator [Mucilaginibacter pineti]SDD98635.1 AraC-type DNA-binding protein [Mucilaginibacter pineti]
MSKKTEYIPVNTLPEESSRGIMMLREAFNGSPNSEQVERSHRDGGYTFIIQEKGKTVIEIDFQIHHIQAPAIIFIHPHQVHRVIAFEDAMICTWIITEENLRPEYLDLLEGLAPVHVLPVIPETLAVLTETATLCMKLSEKKTEVLYHSIFKESVNTLVALILSQYLELSKPAEHHTRSEDITREFKTVLENRYKSTKNPSEYASLLNISPSYLNECVKATTGNSVSYHIQQRVVLEAKRLLYHSGKSVKQISGELGYDDYSYFTRLFTKVVGITPITFRDKNRE